MTITAQVNLLDLIKKPSSLFAWGLSRWDIAAILHDRFAGRSSSVIYISCEMAKELREAGFNIACLHYPDREEGLHNVIFPDDRPVVLGG